MLHLFYFFIGSLSIILESLYLYIFWDCILLLFLGCFILFVINFRREFDGVMVIVVIVGLDIGIYYLCILFDILDLLNQNIQI